MLLLPRNFLLHFLNLLTPMYWFRFAMQRKLPIFIFFFHPLGWMNRRSTMLDNPHSGIKRIHQWLNHTLLLLFTQFFNVFLSPVLIFLRFPLQGYKLLTSLPSFYNLLNLLPLSFPHRLNHLLRRRQTTTLLSIIPLLNKPSQLNPIPNRNLLKPIQFLLTHLQKSIIIIYPLILKTLLILLQIQQLNRLLKSIIRRVGHIRLTLQKTIHANSFSMFIIIGNGLLLLFQLYLLSQLL